MAKALVDLYVKKMRDNYKPKYPAWEPNDCYELGDYGILKGDIFIKIGNVTRFSDNIKFEKKKGPTFSNKSYSLGVTKKNITEIEGRANIKAIDIDASFSIEFSNEGSIFYEAKGVHTYEVDDIAALGAQIKKFWNSGEIGKNGVEMDDEFYVITQIDVVKSAVIIVAETKGAKVDLIAKADIKLADPKLKWEMQNKVGSVQRYDVLKKGATPLFRLMKFKVPKTPWVRPRYPIERKSELEWKPALSPSLESAMESVNKITKEQLVDFQGKNMKISKNFSENP